MASRGLADHLVAELRQLRRDRGLSQAAVAARAGMSREWLNSLESGRHSPNAETLLLWADALGMDLVLREVPGA